MNVLKKLYGPILGKYKQLKDISKAFIIVELVASLSWNIIIPVIGKLQGLYWAASWIALYHIGRQMGNFIVSYIKDKYELSEFYRIIVILDVLYLLSINIYYINVKIFLIIEAILMVVYAAVMGAAEIKFNTHLVKKYGSDEYDKAAEVEKSVSAAAAVVGYLVIMALDVLMPMEHYMGIIAAMLVVNLVFRYRYYAKYWR